MNAIAYDVEIKAAPSRLYELITTPKGLAGWFTPDVDARAELQSLVALTFGGDATLRFRIEELDRDRRVVWTGVDVPEAWKGVRVAFAIVPNDAGTTLRFTQGEFAHDYEDVAQFNYYWAQYMRSLKMLAETGTGEPWGSPGSVAAGTTST
jgi:uncharacterized protein YndB with AHSA1/START domain